MNVAVVKVRRLISKNKAIAAAVTSLGGVLAADAYSLIATGNWNVAETRTAIGAVALAVITYGFTYATSAGDAEIEPQLDQNTASDPQPKQVVIQPV